MCILFFYLNEAAEEGKYRLILVNNRDEYYTRPTRPAAFWEDNTDCISGEYYTYPTNPATFWEDNADYQW